MLRKRISRWTSRSDGGQQPYCAFSESFWQYYVESLAKDSSAGYSDLTAPDPTKYNANSAAVTQIKGLFAPDQPQPSTNQVIASLKSPFSQGDVVKAYHLIRFFQLSDLGFFITNDGVDRVGSPIVLQGAENWEHVMCYLDALLFSMFANLESFEPILFLSNQHPNALVTQLSGLLRVYVNLMRSGNLITTDITQKICEYLRKLGFLEALSHRQQDCAPLFEFLTETLAMPLLTFRVEIQHSGKVDNDDTKYSKERILFVSIPQEEDHVSDEPILLEECLEHYFNNSISVKRELQRRATIEERRLSAKSTDFAASLMSESVSKTNPESNRDLQSSTSLTFPNSHSNPVAAPSQNRVQVRTRSSTLSIWSISSHESKTREVMLPAWMLLRLMPFYTDDNQLNKANESIAKNTHEFANRRPILPICLKRYSFSASDKSANRSRRKIVIPPVIDLPSFLADDINDSKNHSSFKLILESAVCHRGTTIESGHFVSAVRKNTNVENESLEESFDACWYLYDDLKSTKVVTKSFKEIFESEWPYMLFYRLVPSDSSSSSDSINSGSTTNTSANPIFAPKGHKSKYWAEDSLTPIMSSTEGSHARSQASSEITLPEKHPLNQKLIGTKSADSSLVFPNASVPIPDILPGQIGYLDIRKRYLWYVTDKDKNYYKECASLSKTGSRNMSISITPQYRRNSQWSEVSNISGLSLGGDPLSAAKQKLEAQIIPSEMEVKIFVENEEGVGNSEKNRKGQQGAGAVESDVKRVRSKEHRHHLHHIFSHEKEAPPSLSKSHVRKKHSDYRREKCVIT